MGMGKSWQQQNAESKESRKLVNTAKRATLRFVLILDLVEMEIRVAPARLRGALPRACCQHRAVPMRVPVLEYYFP